MKNCTNCQAPINAGDAFCSKCGAKVQVATQAEPKAVAFQPKTVQLGPSPTQSPAPKKKKKHDRNFTRDFCPSYCNFSCKLFLIKSW